MKKYRVHIVTNTGYHMTKEVIVKDPSEIREKLVSVHHVPTGIMDKIFPVLIENKKTYSELKEEARSKAIEWQLDFDNHNYSYGELAYYQDYFERLGRRYGLIKEFKENAII